MMKGPMNLLTPFRVWLCVTGLLFGFVFTEFMIHAPAPAHASAIGGTVLAPGQALQYIFRSGFYYPAQGGTTVINGSLANGTEFAEPFFVPVTTTFTAIDTYVITGGTSGSVIRFGIYADSGGRPGNLVLDCGSQPATSSSSPVEATILQTLTPGLYWLSITGQGGPVSQPVVEVFALNVVPIGYSANTQLVGPAGTYFRTGITGSLSNWSGATTTGGITVEIAMKVQ
jgi:hypothetical protein